MALAILALGAGAVQARSSDFQAYYENAQRLASPHADYGEPWPHFAANDHIPHYDAWGRDLNGPPFRARATACTTAPATTPAAR